MATHAGGEAGMSNKERILHTAIELFAQKGYSNVTMREIAGKVQIKAASIYNHFRGKEALLEEIVQVFRQRLREEVYPGFKTTPDTPVRDFISSVVTANERFFMNPLYAGMGAVLLREQFHSSAVRDMIYEELIARPIQVFAAYFESMMAAGRMRTCDPEMAAKEFHAFFVYRFYENSLTQGRVIQDAAQAKREGEAHILFFLETFCGLTG